MPLPIRETPGLERIQEKWIPVFRPNARQNKDLERFRDSVKFGNALALDLDHERVSKCRARGMPVFYGNATQVQVLRNVGVEHARAAVITLDQTASANQVVAALHEHVPDLPTFVRARTMEHRRHLEVAGATAVVPETVEASLQLGGIVLESLGSSTDQIMGVLGKLRDNDYAEVMGIVHGEDGNGEEQK